MKAERNISADDKRALVRFVEAVESGKRPSAADARVAATFVRVVIEEPRTLFSPIRRGRGQPKDEDKSFPDVAHKIDAAKAVARRVGKREPADPDFAAVGEDRGMSKSSVGRQWRKHGPIVKRQIEDDEAMARLLRTLRQMTNRFGDNILDLSWVKFRPVVESWQGASVEEREQLAKVIRGILGKKPTK